jgi:hypothetical protein
LVARLVAISGKRVRISSRSRRVRMKSVLYSVLVTVATRLLSIHSDMSLPHHGGGEGGRGGGGQEEEEEVWKEDISPVTNISTPPLHRVL